MSLLALITAPFRLVRFLFYVVMTLPRDLRFAWLAYKLKRRQAEFERADANVFDHFRTLVRRHPLKPCIVLHDDETWTYRDMEHYSNRVARFFSGGLRKGDCIALFMGNRP